LKFFSERSWASSLRPRHGKTPDSIPHCNRFPSAFPEILHKPDKRACKEFSARAAILQVAVSFLAIRHFSATESDPIHQNDELDKIPSFP